MPPPLHLDHLTAEERIELIGQLWDSLDPAVAAPIPPALAAELDRREAEADLAAEALAKGDASADASESWPDLRDELRRKLP